MIFSLPKRTRNHLSKDELYRSKEHSVRRLATYLHLDVDGMRHKQICRLVYWRVTRREKLS